MKTVVFLDLDGTLWDHGVVPPSALAAIRAAQARGHLFLTNTGRARSEVPDLTPLGLDGYCFAAGAEVLLDGRHVVDEPLGVTRVRAVMEVFDAFGLNYNLEGGDTSWIVVHDEPMFQAMRARTAGTPDPIASFPRIDQMPERALEGIYKVFYHGGRVDPREVAARLPQDVTLTELGHGLAEATRVGVSKATALEAVRTYLGGDWRTMALGDSDNDLPMLHAADVSVCMGNGNANAKAAATWVTTDLQADGLANALTHFGLIDTW